MHAVAVTGLAVLTTGTRNGNTFIDWSCQLNLTLGNIPAWVYRKISGATRSLYIIRCPSINSLIIRSRTYLSVGISPSLQSFSHGCLRYRLGFSCDATGNNVFVWHGDLDRQGGMAADTKYAWPYSGSGDMDSNTHHVACRIV